MKIHFLFFITVLFISIVLTYESYAHLYTLDISLQDYIQNYGFLTGYEKNYSPGKGIWHLLGWSGSFFMVIMLAYSLRKRISFFQSFGSLKTWLNIHIFLGLVGTLFVTAHTTLRFGGIVSVSFWSMIITALSGIIGRYIYLQIPRKISGSELKVDQIDNVIKDIDKRLTGFPDLIVMINNIGSLDANVYSGKDFNFFPLLFSMISSDFKNIAFLKKIKKLLKSKKDISKKEKIKLLSLIKKKINLNKNLNMLSATQRIFHYWHIIHLPISILMYIIMALHILISLVFKVY